jgi:hypothetical protein
MRVDSIIALFLICTSLWLYTDSMRFPPGAGTFPQLMLIITIVFSIVVLVQDIRKKPAVGSAGAGRLRPYVVFALAAVYGLAIEMVGFFTSSVVFGLVMMYYLGVRRIASYVVAICAMTLFYYVVFDRFLHVPLPKGVLY